MNYISYITFWLHYAKFMTYGDRAFPVEKGRNIIFGIFTFP